MTENLSRKTAVELASMIAAKAASPVEDTDWIAGSFLITLMSLPGGSVPAAKPPMDCRSESRSSARVSRNR
jgi:hypothetical protein